MNKFFFNMITLALFALGSACATTTSAPPRTTPTVEDIDRESPPTVDEIDKEERVVPDDGAPVVVTMTDSERRTKMSLLTGNQDDVLVQPENGFVCTTRWVCNDDRGTCYCAASSSPSGEIAAYPAVE